jgi:hypothetical protein
MRVKIQIVVSLPKPRYYGVVVAVPVRIKRRRPPEEGIGCGAKLKPNRPSGPNRLYAACRAKPACFYKSPILSQPVPHTRQLY